MRAAYSTRLANSMGLPLMVHAVPQAKGESSVRAASDVDTNELKSGFASQCYQTLLLAASRCVRRPRGVNLSVWEELEPSCARNLLVAIVAGRCAFITPSYVRWSFSTLSRRLTDKRHVSWEQASYDAPSESTIEVTIPLWLTRGFEALLSLAHRAHVAHRLLQSRGKEWGLGSQVRKLYLEANVSSACMNRPVFENRPKAFDQVLDIYGKLVFELRMPEEAVERLIAKLVSGAAEVRMRANRGSETKSSSPMLPGVASKEDDTEELAAATPEFLARMLIEMLKGAKQEWRRAIASKSTKYSELVDALRCLSEALGPDCAAADWRLLEGALSELLEADVRESTEEDPLPRASLIAWVARLEPDFKRERPMARVVDDILEMKHFVADEAKSPAKVRGGEANRSLANVGVVARKSTRGWLGGALLAILPPRSLPYEIVAAMATRHVGTNPVDSLAEIRDHAHFQRLLHDSLWGSAAKCDIPLRIERLRAVCDRLAEWDQAIWSLGQEGGGDPSYVFEIPQAIVNSPRTLAQAIELIDKLLVELEAVAAAEGTGDIWEGVDQSENGGLVATAILAAQFSVALEHLSHLAQQLFVERRAQWKQAGS